MDRFVLTLVVGGSVWCFILWVALYRLYRSGNWTPRNFVKVFSALGVLMLVVFIAAGVPDLTLMALGLIEWAIAFLPLWLIFFLRSLKLESR